MFYPCSLWIIMTDLLHLKCKSSGHVTLGCRNSLHCKLSGFVTCRSTLQCHWLGWLQCNAVLHVSYRYLSLARLTTLIP